MATQVVVNGSAVAALIKATSAKAVTDVANQILSDAQTIVPVDTGELRDSLHVSQVEDAHAQVVASTDYAAYVEYGTSRMAAQPYLRPSAYKSRSL